jgi:hypothetical protein
MKIEIIALCEYATVKNGSLTICNTFENWSNLEELNCVFVVKARFEATDSGLHQIFCKFTDQDGKEVFSQAVSIDIQPEDHRSNVGFVIGRMRLSRPEFDIGDYEFEVFDGEGNQKAVVPLYVSAA